MNLRHGLKIVTPKRVLQWIHPRSLHAFCMGTPKSGTTSLTHIFDRSYRADHEPRSFEFIARMHEHFHGRMSDAAFMRYLRQRDKRFWLDLESNCFLGYRPDLVRRTFVDAPVILTVRHPFSWIDSIFDNNANYPASMGAGEARWHEVLLQPGRYDYAPQDAPLERLGLYPLRSYLEYWVRANAAVLDQWPPDALLMVPTHQLDQSRGIIADFLGIPPESIEADHGHHNKTSQRHGARDMLDAQYLGDCIDEVCGALLARPDLAAVAQGG